MKPLIYIIAPEQTFIDNLVKILEQKYATMHSLSSEDALFLFENVCTTVSLVLIDLSLADMNPIELINKLRRVCSVPEIIVFSESEISREVVETMKAGAYDYILKPAEKFKLLKSVKKALNYIDGVASLKKDFREVFLERLEKRLKLIKDFNGSSFLM